MYAQLASFRQTLPAPSISAVSGGSLSAGTRWFRVQFRNLVGLNIGTELVSLSFSAGQRIQFSFPANYRGAAEDVHFIVISAGTAAVASTLVQIAKIKIRNTDGTYAPFPLNFFLSTNEHIALAPSVANPAALPSGVVNGAVRSVSSLGAFYEYRADSTATPDGDTVLSASTGRWHRIETPYTFIADTVMNNGADQALSEITPNEIDVPPYPGDGTPGRSIRVWCRNGFVAGAFPAIEQGMRLGLQVFVDGVPYSRAFSGKMRCIFRGYANTITGALDSSLAGVGVERVIYFGKGDAMVLPSDLPPAWAAVWDIFPQFRANELEGFLGQNSVISFNITVYPVSATEAPWGSLTGDFVTNAGDRRRVYPDTSQAIITSGQVLIDQLLSPVRDSQLLPLSPNAYPQYVATNGNGSVWLTTDLSSLTSSERVRAICGTQTGLGSRSAWTDWVAASNQALVITINHPVTSEGNGVIRLDYPDVVAGSGNGKFNATNVVVYVQRLDDGEIRRWVVAADNAPTQTVTITNFGGVMVPTLPSDPPSNFGLFSPFGLNLSPSSGGSISGSYRVSVAYEYTGAALTVISHRVEDGCLPELGVPIAELSDHLARLDTIESQVAGVQPQIANIQTQINNVQTQVTTQAQLLGAVSDIAALRGLAPVDGRRRLVLTPCPREYYYSSSLTLDDDGVTVIKPSSVPTGQPGRWRLVTLAAPHVADVAALRAVPESVTMQWQLRLVLTPQPRQYYYDGASTDDDDGTNVIKPDWRTTSQPGRWRLILAGASSGSGGDVSLTRIIIGAMLA